MKSTSESLEHLFVTVFSNAELPAECSADKTLSILVLVLDHHTVVSAQTILQPHPQFLNEPIHFSKGSPDKIRVLKHKIQFTDALEIHKQCAIEMCSTVLPCCQPTVSTFNLSCTAVQGNRALSSMLFIFSLLKRWPAKIRFWSPSPHIHRHTM